MLHYERVYIVCCSSKIQVVRTRNDIPWNIGYWWFTRGSQHESIYEVFSSSSRIRTKITFTAYFQDPAFKVQLFQHAKNIIKHESRNLYTINLDRNLANVARAWIFSWNCWSYWSMNIPYMVSLFDLKSVNKRSTNNKRYKRSKQKHASYKRSFDQNKAPNRSFLR